MPKKDLKKIDLIKSLSIKTGYPNKYTKKLIDDLIKIMIINIKEGGFNIKNFGTFKIIEKKERVGRNPKTKKEYLITARKSVSFISSKKNSNNYEKIN